MSLNNLKIYPRVLLLFNDGQYTEYTPGNLATTQEVCEAQMVIAINYSGAPRVLKNRWGYTT
jgi:hypothetical protein